MIAEVELELSPSDRQANWALYSWLTTPQLSSARHLNSCDSHLEFCDNGRLSINQLQGYPLNSCEQTNRDN